MTDGSLRRRTLLGGLAGALAGVGGYGALAATGVLPGQLRLYRALGLDETDPDLPDVEPGPLRTGSFTSARRLGAATQWRISYPPGSSPGDPLPLCLLLHGRGGGAGHLSIIGYDRFLADAVGRGTPPFAIASVDGGDRYWHPRREGDDPAAMVTEEFLPLLAGQGLRTGRFALLGYSMGGYGGLLLASRLGPGRVAAVAAESPALWTDPGDSAPGAFDDREDFERHDVFARRAALREIPLRVDCGLADPFHAAAEEFTEGMDPRPEGDLGRGDHSIGYWRAMAPGSIAFLGKSLER